MIRFFTSFLVGSLFLLVITVNGQTNCYSENFNNGNTNGWTLANGCIVRPYNRPSDCQVDAGGIVTPGVGGNQPTQLTSPQLMAVGGNEVRVSFDLYRMNANLQCSSWADFPCPTTVDVLIHIDSSTYTAIDNLILPHNGPNHPSTISLVINVGDQLPPGTAFAIELDFSKRSNNNNNCVQPNTKYILDNFSICQNNPIVRLDAIDDNLCPLATINDTFNYNLSMNDVHPANANIQYELVNGPYGNGEENSEGASLTINSDGSFNMMRTSPEHSIFDFTYRLTDLNTGLSDLASCKVCFNDAGIVPLNLLSVEAFRKNTLVYLQWSTAMENNMLSYEIQRKMGAVFTTIGSIQATNHPGGSNYQFNEINLSKSTSVYRIKCKDRENHEKYSPLKLVSGIDNIHEIIVFPNPSTGSVSITYGEATNNFSIELMDYTGKMVEHHHATNDNSIKLSNLKKGIYLIKVIDSNSGCVGTKQLIVQ